MEAFEQNIRDFQLKLRGATLGRTSRSNSQQLPHRGLGAGHRYCMLVLPATLALGRRA